MDQIDRLVQYDDLKDFGIPWSRVHVARLVKAEKFPKPFSLNGRGSASVWKESAITAFLDAREQESREREAEKVRLGARLLGRPSLHSLKGRGPAVRSGIWSYEIVRPSSPEQPTRARAGEGAGERAQGSPRQPAPLGLPRPRPSLPTPPAQGGQTPPTPPRRPRPPLPIVTPATQQGGREGM